jgi:hypothetical protein
VHNGSEQIIFHWLCIFAKLISTRSANSCIQWFVTDKASFQNVINTTRIFVNPDISEVETFKNRFEFFWNESLMYILHVWLTYLIVCVWTSIDVHGIEVDSTVPLIGNLLGCLFCLTPIWVTSWKSHVPSLLLNLRYLKFVPGFVSLFVQLLWYMEIIFNDCCLIFI